MKFLVYLDILGFEELAEKLARQTGQVASHVREAFMRTINERIDASYATGMVCSKWWGRSDSWLMVADTMDSAVEACAKMIEHHTGFESVPHLPLELAIGTGVYDAWAVLEDEQLVCQESTIRFLKSNIISRYKQSHKAMRGGSIHKSFVLLTESAYAVLDPVDKLKCTKAGRAPVYYTIHTHQLTQRAEVYDFLRQIGHAGSRLYNRIDELYVQPVEYSYIDECLAEKRLVFITGTAEYGKTFTAVRLLYEYFKKGYRPLWLTGSEETERRVGRMKLEDIDSILTEHTIVYFEDPFGKLKYEKRESLERQIASVVDRIHNYIDAFVVITSREEIFREFKKEKLSLLELETFERKLNITRPSYDAGRRQQILVNWATAMGCCWAENENLKNLVTKRLEDKANLPTPLCIKDFAIASVNVVRASQLIALIARKSIETEMSFALEVRQMGKDQIIFLCLPFLGQFTVDFVREQYERLLKDLSVPAARSFDELLTWFAGRQIAIVEGRVAFAHPSYENALVYLVTTQDDVAIYELFCDVLQKLSAVEAAAPEIAWTLVWLFDLLPAALRDLLFDLASTPAAAKSLSHGLDTLRDLLRRSVFLRIMRTLLSQQAAVRNVTKYLLQHFYELPRQLSSKLLIECGARDEAADAVSEFMLEERDRLPQPVWRKLCEVLSTTKSGSTAVARLVDHEFDSLPKQFRTGLLLKLTANPSSAESITWMVIEHMCQFSPRLRKLLLRNLLVFGRAGDTVRDACAGPLVELPSDAREIIDNYFSHR